MAKFKVGQLVRMVGYVNFPDVLGRIAEVVALPFEKFIAPGTHQLHLGDQRYVIHIPGFKKKQSHCYYANFEQNLAPIDDTDHRTKADEDELIFKPNMTKELTNGSD